jgi:hypothetical protein
MGKTFEPLVDGAVYFNGSAFRRVISQSPSGKKARVEHLLTVELRPHEQNTPTHTYRRFRLFVPLRAMMIVDTVQWGARQGWGIPQTRSGTHRRVPLGLILPPADHGKEWETCSYCD